MLAARRPSSPGAAALLVLASVLLHPVAATTYGVVSLYTNSGCHSDGAYPTSAFVYEDSSCETDTTSCVVTPNSTDYYYETECTDNYEDFLAARFPVGEYLFEEYYNAKTGCYNWAGVIAYPLDGLCHPSSPDGTYSAITTLDDEGSASIAYYIDPTCANPDDYSWTQNITAINIKDYVCQEIPGSENSSYYYNTYIVFNVTDGIGSDFSGESSGSDENGGGLSTGALIGIIAGAVVVLLVVAGVIFYCCRRNKQRANENAAALEAAADPNKVYNPNYGGGDYHSVQSQYQRGQPTMTGSTDPYWSAQNQQLRDSNAATISSGGMWDDDAIVAARIPRDRVMFEGLLSRGGYGEVYVGTYNGQRVAIKTLLPERRKQIRHVNDFLAEVKMMAGLDHPRIVQFIGVAWDSLTNLCVVSEFMSGGDLRALLSSYEASNHPQGFDYNKVKIAMHIAHALTYLHSLQPMIIHRDLKSRNVLLDGELNAKLTDFGVSRERIDATMTAGVGTSLWMAPEIMMGEKYDDKADVFSFGVMLSELDMHGLPYANAKDTTGTGRKMPDTAILQLVTLGKLRVEFSPGAMADVVELGYSCVEVDPSKRPTSAEVLYKLHSILRSIA